MFIWEAFVARWWGSIYFSACWRGWVPVIGFLCLFWRETHTKDLRARFPTRPKEDEKKARFQCSQQKIGVSVDQGKATVRERWLLSEELGPADPEAWSASSRRWFSAPGSWVGIFVRVHDMTDTEAQDGRKVVKTSPFFRLRLTQARA